MDETILIDRIDAAAPIRFFLRFSNAVHFVHHVHFQAVHCVHPSPSSLAFILSHNENYVNFNKTKVEQCQAIAYAASLLLCIKAWHGQKRLLLFETWKRRGDILVTTSQLWLSAAHLICEPGLNVDE